MEEHKLDYYCETHDGKPACWRYGESWEMMRLLLEGGYPTKERAKQAWEEEQKQNNK